MEPANSHLSMMNLVLKFLNIMTLILIRIIAIPMETQSELNFGIKKQFITTVIGHTKCSNALKKFTIQSEQYLTLRRINMPSKCIKCMDKLL